MKIETLKVLVEPQLTTMTTAAGPAKAQMRPDDTFNQQLQR